MSGVIEQAANAKVENCPECDLPLPGSRPVKPSEENRYCWRVYNAGECRNPKVDWRYTAQSMQTTIKILKVEKAALEEEKAVLEGALAYHKNLAEGYEMKCAALTAEGEKQGERIFRLTGELNASALRGARGEGSR